MLNEDSISKLGALEDRHEDIIIVGALVEFALHDSKFSGVVQKAIIANLHNANPLRVISAADAISKWRRSEDSPATQSLCLRLIHLSAAGPMSVLHGILRSLNSLYVENCLNQQQVDALNEVVPIVFDAADYSRGRFQSYGLDETCVSLTRRECARIANAISANDLGASKAITQILRKAAEDPLPEVRFANS